MRLRQGVNNLTYATVVIVILCTAAVRVTESADVTWPQFRGPNGSGVSEETGVPVEFGPGKNLLWKTPVPEGHSSPVIWNDRIFLTAFESGRLETLCLDRNTGEILWRTPVEQKVRKGHSTNSRASPTPATDGERVYVYFGPVGLLAYNFDGKEQWRSPLPMAKQPWGLEVHPWWLAIACC